MVTMTARVWLRSLINSTYPTAWLFPCTDCLTNFKLPSLIFWHICPHLLHMHTTFYMYYTDQLETKKKLCLCYTLPMIATMSANMWFLPSLSMAARCANPGAFILHLYGFELPSDTRYIPNSPVLTIKNQWDRKVIISTAWTWRIQ